MKKQKTTVKELTADGIEEFYDYLKNASVDHYQDNISSVFQSLLRKKLVKYNPTDLVEPIKVETTEVNTYNKSEILGLKIEAFDFEKDYFTKRFNKVIIRNSLKKITPHGLRHITTFKGCRY